MEPIKPYSRVLIQVALMTTVVFTLSMARPTAAGAQGAAQASAPPDSGTFFPRIKLLGIQYPQLVAVSAGGWALLPVGWTYRPGLVADVELGLSGVTFALGGGATSIASRSYETNASTGVQAMIHRTWPWWSPWLSTSTTYVGADVFAHIFAVRCSIGLMWPVSGEKNGSMLQGGCGIGH